MQLPFIGEDSEGLSFSGFLTGNSRRAGLSAGGSGFSLGFRNLNNVSSDPRYWEGTYEVIESTDFRSLSRGGGSFLIVGCV